MSSQCGCRNTESVMTLHSQRYFAMEGISEEQNGTRRSRKPASEQPRSTLPTEPEKSRQRKHWQEVRCSLNKAARSPLRNMKCIYTKGDLTVKDEYIRGRTACKASPNYKSWRHWKCISKWRGHNNVEHCPTLPFCQMSVSSGMTILLSPVPRHKGNQ